MRHCADYFHAGEGFYTYMEAEGIPFQLTTASCNLSEKYPIKSGRMPHPALPPFGEGYACEGQAFDPAVCTPGTNTILSRTVALGVGPAYTRREIEGIKTAIGKVGGHLT